MNGDGDDDDDDDDDDDENLSVQVNFIPLQMTKRGIRYQHWQGPVMAIPHVRFAKQLRIDPMFVTTPPIEKHMALSGVL